MFYVEESLAGKYHFCNELLSRTKHHVYDTHDKKMVIINVILMCLLSQNVCHFYIHLGYDDLDE